MSDLRHSPTQRDGASDLLRSWCIGVLRECVVRGDKPTQSSFRAAATSSDSLVRRVCVIQHLLCLSSFFTASAGSP